MLFYAFMHLCTCANTKITTAPETMTTLPNDTIRLLTWLRKRGVHSHNMSLTQQYAGGFGEVVFVL
jgi:hypothetical protein